MFSHEIVDLINEVSPELFRSLSEVLEITYWWRNDYNELRPHDSLGDLTPSDYMIRHTENPTLQLPT
jgi:putative transposase